MANCLHCKTKLTGKQTMYCSVRCKMREHQTNTYASQQRRARRRKRELIKLKGGGCQLCGYNKNEAVLSFHHRDPTTKSFGIDTRRIGNNCWKVVLAEAEKCDLLCANCHLELHHPSCENKTASDYQSEAAQT